MRKLVLALGGIATCLIAASIALADPLPSWNDGPSKRAIVDFVVATTTPASTKYVSPAERVAVFDNDGTLWSEQPAYFQAIFLAERIRELAPQHPEWKTTEPFASVLRGDLRAALASGAHALLDMSLATQAGMTTEEFEKGVSDWIATARHPISGRLYTEMVFEPMLEVLRYLRANGFKTFIVSGSGVDFMRAWTERIYGIPPEQVIGSSGRTVYEVRDGKPVLVKIPEVNFINDREGKPVGIYQHIGRRPIIAFGNSDGDFQMLEWTTAGGGPRLCLIVHHDDAKREFAYDRDSSIGRLARGLDEGPKRGWIIVSIRNDWRQVYP